VADDRASIPLIAVTAGDGMTTQTQEFLHLIETLRHGSRFLPLTTVDLTDPPLGDPADGRTARRALQQVG
jgi:hypothetical protein